jgi:hypothetical protein
MFLIWGSQVRILSGTPQFLKINALAFASRQKHLIGLQEAFRGVPKPFAVDFVRPRGISPHDEIPKGVLRLGFVTASWGIYATGWRLRQSR